MTPGLHTVIRIGAAAYDVTSTLLAPDGRDATARIDLAQRTWGLNRHERLEALTPIGRDLANLHDIRSHECGDSRSLRKKRSAQPLRLRKPHHHQPIAPLHAPVPLEM